MTNLVEAMRALKGRLSRGVFSRVPADIELCEFNCRRLECSHNEWENCERRLKLVDLSETGRAAR